MSCGRRFMLFLKHRCLVTLKSEFKLMLQSAATQLKGTSGGWGCTIPIPLGALNL